MNLAVMLVLFQVVVLIFAFTVHEAAHGWVAKRLGDPTASMLGRVTLNPLKHIDPWGSIVMPMVALFSGFPLLGWAKPCPVTPGNFKNYKRDDILTSLAGPASNLLVATLAAMLLIVLRHAMGDGAMVAAMDLTAGYRPDAALAELPPAFPIALLLYYSILTNLLLFVFNLIPVPPLDGSHILRHFLPYNAEKVYDQIGNYGMILVFLAAGALIKPIYQPLLALFDTIVLAL